MRTPTFVCGGALGPANRGKKLMGLTHVADCESTSAFSDSRLLVLQHSTLKTTTLLPSSLPTLATQGMPRLQDSLVFLQTESQIPKRWQPAFQRLIR